MMLKTFISPRGSLAVSLLACGGLLCRGQEQQVAANESPVQMKVVKSMPFSAKIVTEANQTLADGNHIVRTSTAVIARDSEGRTRREQGNAVFLFDPLVNTAYVLDTKTHTIRKFAVKALSSVQPNETQTEAKPEHRVMEGLSVEGTHLRRVIPPREAGNDAPLEILSEVWYSSELQEPILTRTLDPRSGETTSQLKEIQRAEPDHSLFEVPPDFNLEEGGTQMIPKSPR